jgi:hypothetical protein
LQNVNHNAVMTNGVVYLAQLCTGNGSMTIGDVMKLTYHVQSVFTNEAGGHGQIRLTGGVAGLAGATLNYAGAAAWLAVPIKPMCQ